MISSLQFTVRTAKRQLFNENPNYQVLLIEDHSSSTRSRIQIRIVVPEARTARERARVSMNAAREILASQLSDVPKNLQYE